MDDSHLHRFRAKFHRDGECWIWHASRTHNGYGVFADTRKTARAHRMSYLHFVGPIPAGHQLDHLCRNRACVNPAHLEPVTAAENSRRGDGGQNMAHKTHCQKGHAYDAANTRVYRGARFCRVCSRLRQAAPTRREARRVWDAKYYARKEKQ